MNIIIAAKNFDLTEGIKNYIEERFSKINRLADIPLIRVFLEANKYGQKIEVLVSMKEIIIRAKDEKEDLYDAIEGVAEKLKSLIKKNIARINDFEDISLKHYEEQEEDLIEKPHVVKRKSFSLKPMSEEEAILQMEMLGHQAFMFLSSELNCMCLLYRRKDGQYGLIEGHY